jgi:hypothetical protein
VVSGTSGYAPFTTRDLVDREHEGQVEEQLERRDLVLVTAPGSCWASDTRR